MEYISTALISWLGFNAAVLGLLLAVFLTRRHEPLRWEE
ncbi:hypothetical protein DERA104750_12720 [Deinococcus radiodurans]|jgi:hypothetical protein